MIEHRPSASASRVTVLGTGGTIGFEGSGGFDVVDYGETGRLLSITELLERMPEVAELAELDLRDVVQVGSNEVGAATWLELRSEITRILNEDESVDGIVITHGSATLEETAYFLHLTLPTEKPVVLVAAQRPVTALSSDAAMNLASAIRLASSKLAAGLGVTVVMNDEVHSARDVTKSAMHRLDAFESPGLGPLGHVEGNGSIAIYRSPLRRHTIQSRFAEPGYLHGVTALPRVEIAYSYAGSEGLGIQAAVEAGARAIVVAAFPPGLVTPGEQDAIDVALSRGISIIVSSRASRGRVLGRAVDREQGLVISDDLSPQKARVLAMLALLRKCDHHELQKLYTTY